LAYLAYELNIFVVFFIPSAVLDVASMTPLTGLTIKPVIPLSPPLKNPFKPYFCVPFNGSVTNPVMPVNRPLNMLLPPLTSPSPT
jgi:hypothetical protein